MDKRYYKHKIENLLVIQKIVTIHYFEFDKNFVGPSEAHDFWELVYADKGSVICSADGKDIHLQEGELLFHKPNEKHSLRANGNNAPNIFIISFVCKSEALYFFENKKITLQKNFIRFIYSIIDEAKKTFDLPYSDPKLKKMKLLQSPTLGGQQLIKNYLEILLINVMRNQTQNEETDAVFLPQEKVGEQIAEQIISLFKSHIYDKMSINDVCASLNYNKSYIFAQFKKATNRSVMAYFLHLKIEQAKRLLRETSLSVTQISEKLAFEAPNYFSKAFKKKTGYTPLQYKKIHKRF